jgi:hypothetical protein
VGLIKKDKIKEVDFPANLADMTWKVPRMKGRSDATASLEPFWILFVCSISDGRLYSGLVTSIKEMLQSR